VPLLVSWAIVIFLSKYQPINIEINNPPSGSIILADKKSRVLKKLEEIDAATPKTTTTIDTMVTALRLNILNSSCK